MQCTSENALSKIDHAVVFHIAIMRYKRDRITWLFEFLQYPGREGTRGYIPFSNLLLKFGSQTCLCVGNGSNGHTELCTERH